MEDVAKASHPAERSMLRVCCPTVQFEKTMADASLHYGECGFQPGSTPHRNIGAHKKPSLGLLKVHLCVTLLSPEGTTS